MYVMKSMEYSDDEQLDFTGPLPLPEKPKFPYGLRICLTAKELDKLGLDTSEAEVGGTVSMHCMARVTSVSDGEMGPRVELQIEDMCIESDDEEEEAPRRPRADPKALYDRS